VIFKIRGKSVVIKAEGNCDMPQCTNCMYVVNFGV